MNKIRQKHITFLLVDRNGNFSEITSDMFDVLESSGTMTYESLHINRPEENENTKAGEFVIEDAKSGNIVYESTWADCTIAQGIDGYFTDLFTNDAPLR